MRVDEHRPGPRGPALLLPPPLPAWPRLAGLKATALWTPCFRSTAAGGTYSAEGLVPQGPGASSRTQASCPPDPSSGPLSARGR